MDDEQENSGIVGSLKDAAQGVFGGGRDGEEESSASPVDRLQTDTERGTGIRAPSGTDTAVADYASTGTTGDTGTADFGAGNAGTDFNSDISMAGTGDSGDAGPSSDEQIAAMSRSEDGDGGIISRNDRDDT